mgnify:CR=1 FL=1
MDSTEQDIVKGLDSQQRRDAEKSPDADSRNKDTKDGETTPTTKSKKEQ